MQTLDVNGYDMAYLELGQGRPLVCVHGSLGDFRTFQAVIGPLSRYHQIIAVSLRHFFPEHWDGVGGNYKIDQHVADLIAFIEQIEPRPVNLMGHSRGGHLAFRVAQSRPDLVRKLVLAEPGGVLDATLVPLSTKTQESHFVPLQMLADKIRAGDLEGAVQEFYEGIEGSGRWAEIPAPAKQQLRDNVFTLLGQIHEGRKPLGKADAQSIISPTLLIGGSETDGSFLQKMRALAAEIADARVEIIDGAGHWMFDQAPQQYCTLVNTFLWG